MTIAILAAIHASNYDGKCRSSYCSSDRFITEASDATTFSYASYASFASWTYTGYSRVNNASELGGR